MIGSECLSAASETEGLEFFEKRIRPLLSEQCFECHSAQSKKVKGGLLLKPGHPELSLIHHRMGKTGLGRMPHVGSNVVDEAGLKLVGEWIKALPEK